MLNKLVKYDLLFGLKRYCVLFALLGGTWLSGLLLSFIGNSYLNAALLIINIIATILFAGAYIITSLQFFYNSLSSDESYFTYTVPASTVSLVFSKLAVIWMWGAAMIGALTLVWVSLYFTLLSQMGLTSMITEIPGFFVEFAVSVVISQFIMQSCTLAFSVSLFNTPRLKITNSGIVIVAVIAYLLSQTVGVITIGATVLWQFIADAGIFKELIDNSLSSGQEVAFIRNMQSAIVATSVVFSPLLFWLTVRTVKKHRSV